MTNSNSDADYQALNLFMPGEIHLPDFPVSSSSRGISLFFSILAFGIVFAGLFAVALIPHFVDDPEVSGRKWVFTLFSGGLIILFLLTVLLFKFLGTFKDVMKAFMETHPDWVFIEKDKVGDPQLFGILRGNHFNVKIARSGKSAEMIVHGYWQRNWWPPWPENPARQIDHYGTPRRLVIEHCRWKWGFTGGKDRLMGGTALEDRINTRYRMHFENPEKGGQLLQDTAILNLLEKMDASKFHIRIYDSELFIRSARWRNMQSEQLKEALDLASHLGFSLAERLTFLKSN